MEKRLQLEYGWLGQPIRSTGKGATGRLPVHFAYRGSETICNRHLPPESEVYESLCDITIWPMLRWATTTKGKEFPPSRLDYLQNRSIALRLGRRIRTLNCRSLPEWVSSSLTFASIISFKLMNLYCFDQYIRLVINTYPFIYTYNSRRLRSVLTDHNKILPPYLVDSWLS
jgi:hypothetical protein